MFYKTVHCHDLGLTSRVRNFPNADEERSEASSRTCSTK